MTYYYQIVVIYQTQEKKNKQHNVYIIYWPWTTLLSKYRHQPFKTQIGQPLIDTLLSSLILCPVSLSNFPSYPSILPFLSFSDFSLTSFPKIDSPLLLLIFILFSLPSFLLLLFQLTCVDLTLSVNRHGNCVNVFPCGSKDYLWVSAIHTNCLNMTTAPIFVGVSGAKSRASSLMVLKCQNWPLTAQYAFTEASKICF